MSSFLWQRIRAARKWAKLTQQQVADQLGITREAISLWENASKGIHPELSRLQAFSRITGAPLSWLVDDNADLDEAWLDRVSEVDAELMPVAESATTDSNSDILSSLQDALVAADEATRKAAADLLSRYAEAPDNESIANALRALLRRPQ